MNNLNFQDTIKKGKLGEIIFREDFLEFLGIKYKDVTNCQQFQAIDSDYLAKIGLYEVKTNYKDDKKIIIEEYTNFNKELGPISGGWLYKSKADLLVSISKKTRTMVLIPLSDNFKEYYENIKEEFALRRNTITESGSNKWQSAFRKIPLERIKGYYSLYRRLKSKF